MKFMLKSKTLGFVILLAVVTLFFFLPRTRANTAGKPPKWRAEILSSSQNMQGYPAPEHIYVSGENGVTISSGTSRCGTGPTMTYYSYIDFQISLPTQILFTLSTLQPFWSDPDPTLVSCGFPETQGSWPSCLFNFLSQPQPYEGYQFALLRFSTCGCEDRTDSDFTKMLVGSWLKTNFRFYIDSSQNAGRDCPQDCNSVNYHRVRGTAHGYIKNGSPMPDIYIFRDSENM
jgi:hypothetical protein